MKGERTYVVVWRGEVPADIAERVARMHAFAALENAKQEPPATDAFPGQSGDRGRQESPHDEPSPAKV